MITRIEIVNENTKISKKSFSHDKIKEKARKLTTVVSGTQNSLRLTADEIRSLEELYEPHNLSGVMAQNTPAARATEQVWIKNGKYRK